MFGVRPLARWTIHANLDEEISTIGTAQLKTMFRSQRKHHPPSRHKITQGRFSVNIPIGEATSKPRVVTRTTYFGREDMKILFLLKKVREVSVKSTLNRVKDSLITSTITCCWNTLQHGNFHNGIPPHSPFKLSVRFEKSGHAFIRKVNEKALRVPKKNWKRKTEIQVKYSNATRFGAALPKSQWITFWPFDAFFAKHTRNSVYA